MEIGGRGWQLRGDEGEKLETGEGVGMQVKGKSGRQ